MAQLSFLQDLGQNLSNVSPLIPLLFIFSAIFLLRLTRAKRGKMPKSPPGLPIIGNLHQLTNLPHRGLHALSKKYGPIMLMHLGHVPTVVIQSAEMAREIMKNHDIIFANRPRTTASRLLLYGGIDIAFSPYGEFWRETTKVCVRELLGPKSVQYFHYIIEEEVEIMIQKVRRSCGTNEAINMSELLFSVANNIATRCILGLKCEEEDGTMTFRDLSKRLLIHFKEFSVADYFPSFGWIDVLTGLTGRMKQTHIDIDAFLENLIKEHKILKERVPDGKEDFLDILIKLRKDNSQTIKLTYDNLKAIVLDMFVAGSDTPSTNMEWTLAEMAKNPRVLKKVQEEVRRVVGKKTKIEASDVNHMTYLKYVVKEALRLHPPAPFLLPRESSARVQIGDYDIPAKTQVFVNSWAIQMDSKHWDKPEKFIPERFDNNPVDFKGEHFQYIPFGGGRRGCPGLPFGVAEVEYVIANILYWFDWALPNDIKTADKLDMSEIFGLNVRKKLPLHLVATVPK